MTLQIVVRPEDRVGERSWLLEKIAGASGVIVMAFTDKVHIWLAYIMPLAPPILMKSIYLF